jgi:hypothetical protein
MQISGESKIINFYQSLKEKLQTEPGKQVEVCPTSQLDRLAEIYQQRRKSDVKLVRESADLVKNEFHKFNDRHLVVMHAIVRAVQSRL